MNLSIIRVQAVEICTHPIEPFNFFSRNVKRFKAFQTPRKREVMLTYSDTHCIGIIKRFNTSKTSYCCIDSDCESHRKAVQASDEEIIEFEYLFQELHDFQEVLTVQPVKNIMMTCPKVAVFLLWWEIAGVTPVRTSELPQKRKNGG